LLAFLTAALTFYEVVEPWHLIAISLVTGVLLSFDLPSRQAIVPNLVPKEDLLNAIVLYSFLFGGAAIIGPSFMGPMVNHLGLDGLFFFVGIMYAGTVAFLLLMKPMPRDPGVRKGRLWGDLRRGLAYTRGHTAILTLISIAVVTGIFGSSFGTLLPIFAREILGGDVQSYSFLLLSAGVGGLLGTVALALFVNLKNSFRLQLVAGVGFGVSLTAFSRIGWLPASIAAIGFVGGSGTVFGTINTTLVQSLVADEYRGRVMSVHQLGLGATAIGGLLMGSLAQVTGAPFTLALSGIVTAVAAATLIPIVARSVPSHRLSPDLSAQGGQE
jgi:predicted MFS family arabinose efflux permease